MTIYLRHLPATFFATLLLASCQNSQNAALEEKVTAMSEQLAEMEDVRDIRALKRNYGHYLDVGDYESFLSLFTDNVTLDMSALGAPKMTVSNVEVADLYKKQLTGRTTQHFFTDMEIRIEGDTAETRFAYYSIHKVDGERADSTGWSYETYKKTADGWKISSVKLVPYISPFTP